MKNKFSKKDYIKVLEGEAKSLSEALKDLAIGSDEYQETLDRLERINTIINEGKRNKISPDTIAMVAGNLLGIALILNYEKAGVITSKALGFVLKGRV